MIETIYADIGYASLTKDGQMICGDHVEKVQCLSLIHILHQITNIDGKNKIFAICNCEVRSA